MFIRFITTPDDSPIGRVALGYMAALIRIAPVRLVDPKIPIFELLGPWARFSRALTTPMDGSFVNVVFAPPERWTWTQRIAAPVKNRHIALAEDGEGEPEAEATEEIVGDVELYTAVNDRTRCLRNVLLWPRLERALTTAEIATARKYEAHAGISGDPIVTGVLDPSVTFEIHVPPITTPISHAAFRRLIRGGS